MGNSNCVLLFSFLVFVVVLILKFMFHSRRCNGTDIQDRGQAFLRYTGTGPSLGDGIKWDY
jgi:hypothetical protein